MILLLCIIIVGLLIIIYLQYKKKEIDSLDLIYIHEKLHTIINDETSEKLLVVTDNKELQSLLIAINDLLSYNQQIIGKHTRMEHSMRRMLSNISHDLKTPLTVVVGYLEILNVDEELDEQDRKYLLTKVHSKMLEVLEMMQEFFDLAKLESGDKELPITRININETCRSVILSFYEILTMKGIEVSINIPEAPIYASGNTEALNRILNNLISNAISYGADGNIIGINVRADEQNVYVEVWDRGKGIDELHIDCVFERMYTLDDSRNKNYQGSGLGLTITKRLVERLGGEIHLSSKPNEQTIFTFSLQRVSY
ncbi:sensor histidine kinase [Bacillus ndiopicus]|uniref:sensor histidine kinase n=1 Tax=Bacillus ndiopicus TaxID=1347368 RepID=UPI0005A7541C|nr:sensor histidine kinase [Bacillus ndiopicus]